VAGLSEGTEVNGAGSACSAKCNGLLTTTLYNMTGSRACIAACEGNGDNKSGQRLATDPVLKRRVRLAAASANGSANHRVWALEFGARNAHLSITARGAWGAAPPSHSST
jgi:hypothetical protein